MFLALKNLARVLLASGEVAAQTEAVDLLLRAVDIDGSDAHSWLELGRVALMHLHHTTVAQSVLERALAIPAVSNSSLNTLLWDLLLDCHCATGNDLGACAVATRLLIADPHHAKAHVVISAVVGLASVASTEAPRALSAAFECQRGMVPHLSLFCV